MRLPRLVTSTPQGVPAGTLTLSSVFAGRGTSSMRSTSAAANAAATVKSKPPSKRKSRAPAPDCWDTAIAGRPSTTPSSAAATVPE